MGSVLTHTFGTYTVFRTIHSIYENTNEVASCIVAFTPCNDMMLSPSTMEYELQDVFDTFDYLLKNQFDSFAKCEQRSRVNSYLRVFKKQPLLKFTKLMIDNSDCEQRSRANNINDEYDVISALYLMCKNPNFATLADTGFEFINMTGEG